VLIVLAVLSWVFATALAWALMRRWALHVSGTLFAAQLAALVAAYEFAGTGSGKVHGSPAFVVIGVVAELVGAYALAGTYEARRA
jgi:hypothetical protein